MDRPWGGLDGQQPPLQRQLKGLKSGLSCIHAAHECQQDSERDEGRTGAAAAEDASKDV